MGPLMLTAMLAAMLATMLAAVLMLAGAPALAATAPPPTPAPVWNLFLFTANAAGSAARTLELREPGGRVWRTFTVTINAQ